MCVDARRRRPVPISEVAADGGDSPADSFVEEGGRGGLRAAP